MFSFGLLPIFRSRLPPFRQYFHQPRALDANTSQDVISDGDMQDKVLGAAQRTEDGFFTAPRVVEK